ncbi:MAG TPA: hypothetical protein EYP08_06085, partial [Pyrodictiaceae archaeon]|nr:hypothetical protein [Pyrodictiaceae archaeon]
DNLSFYRLLRSKNPSPYLFLLEYEDFCIAGSSPEVMVRLTDDRILLRPIAGTRKRGKTIAKDLEMEHEMLNDPKEVAEHIMLIDLGRNDVGRVAKVGTVEVTDKMRVERYSHVMHMVSDVEALNVIREAGREYGKLTGRSYEKLIDCYKCEDADYLFIGIGSWMGDAKIAVEKLREEGLRYGVARLRWIRPFPVDELLEIASGKKLLVVMDRSISMGHTGPLYADTSGAIGLRIPVYGVVAGIGGVDISYEDFTSIGKWAVKRFEEGSIYLPLTWYHNGVFNYMYPIKV